MKALKTSPGVLDHQRDDGWLQITPGERFKIRTSVKETRGIYTMLELIADPRNGVQMHIHQNEDEHFVVLEGSLHIASGDQRFDAPAGTAVTIAKGVPHAWCNLTNAPLRMLVIFSPGNIEDLFKATAARESDDIAALAARYGHPSYRPAASRRNSHHHFAPHLIVIDAKEMRVEFHMRTAPLILLVALIILISLMAAAKDTIADNGNFTSCLVTFWRRGTLCNSVSVRFTPESRHREGWPSCVVLLRYC